MAVWVLIAGLVVFFAMHAVRIVAAPFRDAQVTANPGRWKGLYSLASLIGFGLIIWGWVIYRSDAPDVFEPPAWGRQAAHGLVLLGFISLAAAYAPAGWIKGAVQHPMLIGVALWALGHLLANGDLASLLLFGSFFAYALVDRIAVAFRPAPASAAPALRGDVIAIVIGAGLYALFALWLHQLLFGVSPFP